MVKSTVENKYNLTIKDIRKLKIGDRNKICEPLFWRNSIINAWCIIDTAGTYYDKKNGTDNEYWIGIYDEDAESYAGKFRFYFSAYGGMCKYEFNKFFQEKDIESPLDLEIQEKFLLKINELVDLGILVKDNLL